MNDHTPAPKMPPMGADLAALVTAHYGELRTLAERQLFAAATGGAKPQVSPTSLLGEAFERLSQQRTRITSKEHLSAIATMIFVRALADRRRRELAAKRGGGVKPLSIEDAMQPSSAPSAEEEAIRAADLDRLHEKLAELAEREPRRAEALSLHSIGGLTVSKVAELLDVSVATVERDLVLARAWLATQMKD